MDVPAKKEMDLINTDCSVIISPQLLHTGDNFSHMYSIIYVGKKLVDEIKKKKITKSLFLMFEYSISYFLYPFDFFFILLFLVGDLVGDSVG